MIVHRSNRIEGLVDALADLVGRPLPSPFAPEWIAVQGRGMGRWLAMELARRRGIWANPAFPFPRAVIDEITAAVLGPVAADPPAFDPDALLWAIAETLPHHLDRAAFAPIRAYLDDDARGVKELQLAARIADLFDQYAVYRPEMVLGWERGAEGDWQAELWRALVRTHGAQHTAARAHALLAALAAGRAPGDGFPARISLFGLSTLPPLYVRILAALPDTIELHLFQLSPSREYWGEMRSRRATIRALARGGAASDLGETVDAAEGHPLLAALGRVGREFQQVLEAQADYQEAPQDRYVDPGTGSILAALQSDILALRSRGMEPGHTPPLALPAGDDSIAVHACHGPMREVEVLHDQLLALFDRDPTLEPQHVVVMTPAIDRYAPVIEAVFGGSGRPAIPFRIADRSARAEHEVIDAFMRALDLLRGRLPASAVVDLLALDPVRARFGIAADELAQVRRWVAESGIRWGADGAHRAELGQPDCGDNTWRFGLDRLLLGYALPGADAVLFGGVLPGEDIEGADAALLGRLAEFCDTLHRARTVLREPRPPAAWRDALRPLLAALVATTPATAYQHQAIAAALDALAARATAGGFRGTVDCDAVRPLLERELARDASPRGFLTGAVTFCELVPMRTIPFRVVCLVGLNDGDFPRLHRPLGFDRMAERPQPGDRTARDDDRYLFLEAVLAARERLIITYVGQSISDNTALPPSGVVDELLDTIDRTYGAAAGVPARARVVQRHALQAFSPRYFGRDPALFSYAATYYAGAVALVSPRAVPPPFLAAPLPADPVDAVSLDELVRFFENPSRWFLQRRVALYLGRDAKLLEDREPIELNNLDRWRVGDVLLGRMLRAADNEGAWAALRAGGTLPLGVPGRCAFDAIAPHAAALAGQAAARRGGARLPAQMLDLDLDGVRLTGVLRDLWPGGQITAQYAKLGGRHELSAWIRHLALAAGQPPGRPTLLVGRPKAAGGPLAVRFRPVGDPLHVLATLVRLFRDGQGAPLPFFTHASRAFAGALYAPEGTFDRALRAAQATFTRSDHRASDAADAYVAELYPADLPLTAAATLASSHDFAAVARAVFEPFMAHREVAA